MQERTIAGYALMHGMKIDQTFVERGVSGSKPLSERPQGAALLAAIKPGDTVITPKLDRMFRSALDALGVLADLKKRGIALHMIDLGGDVISNGVSKLVFTILSAVAEAERDRTRERIAEVKRDQRTRGRYLGGKPPFGWKVGDDGELVAIPEQQAASRGCERCGTRGFRIGPSPSDRRRRRADQPHGRQKMPACCIPSVVRPVRLERSGSRHIGIMGPAGRRTS